MAICPVCNSAVPDDFGLIECAKCAAQLIVHMDGRVEASGPSEVSPHTRVSTVDEDPKTHFAFPFDSPPPAPTSVADVEPTQLVQSRDVETSVDDLDSGHEPIDSEPELDSDFTTPLPFEDSPEPEAEPEADPEPSFHFDSAVESEAPPPPDATEVLAGPPVIDEFAREMAGEEPLPVEVRAPPAAPADLASSDLSDIAGFGNSEASAARDGSLRYNIFVTGIDTVDMRNEFREAITDRKLVWDTDQILRSVRNGEVRIANVPAAKAYIFVSRMRNLPFQVRWEQYAISQT